MGNRLARRTERSRKVGVAVLCPLLLVEPGCKDRKPGITDEVRILSSRSDDELGACDPREIRAIGDLIATDTPESIVRSLKESEGRIRRLDLRLTEMDGAGLPGFVDRQEICGIRGSERIVNGRIFILLPVLPKEDYFVEGEMAKGMHLFRFLHATEKDYPGKTNALREWANGEDRYSASSLTALFRELKD